MSLRVTIIGYGAIARVHADILQREGVAFETVVGRTKEDAAAFAAEFGFKRHGTNLSEALASDDSDAVVITSPSELHYQHAKQALEAGRQVLAEIPLAMNYTEGAELVDLAQRLGRTMMVAHSRRFIAPLATLRERTAEGSLHVHHLVGRWGLLRRENVGWTGRRRSWKDNLLWHHGCHLVDFALWFLNASDAEVRGQISRPDPRTGIPMDLDIWMRTPAGQLVSLSLSYNVHMRMEEYLAIGEEESLRFDQGRVYGPAGPRDDLSGEGWQKYMQTSWEAQDREFLAALREGRPPSVTGHDVLPALRVLQRLQDSLLPVL
jgi:2-hydroxy-4-carboxymuconate semialdehyde hemiacetal dehydrogenase